MHAFVPAAGLGTRLRPLTDHTPKALLLVQGRPLLDHVLGRLAASGFRHVVVNAHHHAAQMVDWIARRRATWEGTLEVSVEPELLDTGGGLRAAERWLAGAGAVLVHNADVLSDLPLARFWADHRADPGQPLATLALQERPSRRRLLVDGEGRVIARHRPDTPVPAGHRALAFSGIQIVDTRWFALTPAGGSFPVLDQHLRLAAAGAVLRAWTAEGYAWRDCGRPEDFTAAQGG